MGVRSADPLIPSQPSRDPGLYCELLKEGLNSEQAAEVCDKLAENSKKHAASLVRGRERVLRGEQKTDERVSVTRSEETCLVSHATMQTDSRWRFRPDPAKGRPGSELRSRTHSILSAEINKAGIHVRWIISSIISEGSYMIVPFIDFCCVRLLMHACR
jgi:hypothetical protein